MELAGSAMQLRLPGIGELALPSHPRRAPLFLPQLLRRGCVWGAASHSEVLKLRLGKFSLFDLIV